MATGDKLTIGNKNDATSTTSLTMENNGSGDAVLKIEGRLVKPATLWTRMYGVRAEITSVDGAAILGYARWDPNFDRPEPVPYVSGVGVHGLSDHRFGVVGRGGLNGVYGWTTFQDGCGVVGQVFGTSPNAFGVFAWGDMACSGVKSAAVPHPSGGYQLLYSIESPECWFEDFGTARLRRGRAKVAMPKDFGPLVKTSKYHVFLTPEGDCNGLYVTRKTPRGFEVRESRDGKTSVRFSYRIVAKRRDVSAPRLRRTSIVKPDPRTQEPAPKGPRGKKGAADGRSGT